MLIDKTKSAANGNQDDMLFLIQRFMPLIKKLAFKLNYEDATEDLILDFIEFVKDFDYTKMRNQSDGAMVNYFFRTLYHSYVKRLKAHFDKGLDAVYFEDLQEKQISKSLSIEDPDPFSFELPASLLTPKEICVLKSIYFEGYSSAAIANDLGVTRQNINQIKKSAEQKLRNLYYI